MIKRPIAAIILAAAFVVGPACSRVSAQTPQALYLIDKPTAGILPHGAYALRGRTGPESSFLLGLRIGFKDVAQVGVSAGMHNVFERGQIDVDEHIAFKVRVRLIQEADMPALAVGFDSQGSGVYHEDLKRYDRKSLGFYGVLSRNYVLALGELGLHGGINWSLENEDDSDINIFGGAEFTVLERLSFLLDADAGLNDNYDNNMFGSGGYYLDAGVRLYAGESIVLTLVFRDLAANEYTRVGREFEVALIEFF